MRKGFTLIELLVVVAIIGLLATVVVVNVAEARAKSRDARRKTDMKGISTSAEMYYDSNNSVYPANTAALIPTYLTVVPTDPKYKTTATGSTPSNYGYAGNNSGYAVGAVFEVNTPKSCRIGTNSIALAADGVTPLFNISQLVDGAITTIDNTVCTH